jgi:hypothetical protein
MSGEIERKQSSGHPIVRKVAAGAVLVVAGVVVIHVFLGLIMTIVYVALAIAVIVAVVWAINQLL